MKRNRIYICGGDYTHLQPRDDCPNQLHDWPLPAGYVEASEVADARLRRRWSNRRCPQCKIYGWEPGTKHESTHPVHVPHGEDTRPVPEPNPESTIILHMEKD